MKFIFQLFIFFFLWCFSSSFAQTPFVQYYTSKLYKGGFQTWKVAQDSSRIIYVANSDVILRYDGSKWESILCKANTFARVMHTAPNGTIYLAGDALIGYLEKQEDGSTKIHSLADKLPADVAQNLAIYTIAANKKLIVFASNKVLYVYDLATQKFKIIHIPDQLKSLWSIGYLDVFVFQERICIYTNNNFFYIENSTLKPWKALDSIQSQISLSYVGTFPDNKDLLFALSDKNELYLLELQNAKLVNTRKISSQVSPFLKGKDIFILEGLRDGLLAINMIEEGLIIMNTKGEIIYQMKREQGLNGNTYNHLFQDAMNNIWITGHEISQIMLSSPIDYYQSSLQGDPILSLAKNQEYKYVGRSSRIEYQANSKNFKTIVNTNDETWNFFEFDNQCFAATSRGILLIEKDKSELILNQRYVLCLEKIDDNTFVFGTYDDGLWRLRKEGNQWKKKNIKGLKDEIRFIKKRANGELWIGNYSKGIHKLKLNTALDSITYNKNYDTKQGLPSDVNNRIYRFKSGDIVFTTEDGFYQYDQKNDRFRPHPKFRDALKGKCVYNFVEHPSGDMYVWLGEQTPSRQVGGVLKKQASGNYQLDTRSFHRIEIPANNFIVDVDVPMLVLDNGKVWLAIGDKLYEYNPEKKANIKQPFSMAITLAKAEGTKYTSMLLFKNQVQINNTPIPFEFNKLHFEFAAQHYKEESKIRYQYFLKGQDKQWSEWSYQSTVNFINLSEGKYTLYVKAKDIYDLESNIVSYSFKIKAPFYRTWWAYLIYFSLATVLVVIIVNIYTKNLRKQTFLLEQKVEERTQEIQQKNEEILAQRDDILKMNDVLRHQKEEVSSQAEKLREANQIKNRLFSIISHDLRSPLNQLMATMQIFRSGDFSEEELQKILPELSNSVQNTLSLTDNLLFWAKSQMEGLQIMPEKFELNSLIKDNIQLFTPIATRKNIHIQNKVSGDIGVFADKEMIKLVLRNLINNAVKFCESGDKITISSNMNADKKEIEVLIQDTGIGIAQDKIALLFSNQMQSTRGTSNEKGTGLGLVLCKEFLEKNKGSIRVESVYSEGSLFYITLPIAD